MNDDHGPLCSEPASCSVCQLWPAAGETRADFLARIGALYRAASAVVLTPCRLCGTPFPSTNPDHPGAWCSQRCRSRASRAKKRAARTGAA